MSLSSTPASLDLSDSTGFIEVINPDHHFKPNQLNQLNQLNQEEIQEDLDSSDHWQELNSDPTTTSHSSTDDHYTTTTTTTHTHPHPHPHPHPQLDLSSINSDQTDASINSLFSFPDPLESVDEIIQNSQSDQFHSDWFGRYHSSPTQFLPSLSSDHQSNFSSHHLDSTSPSLDDTDLQSQQSLSSPLSPLISLAGCGQSHRLSVHLCGPHQLSKSEYQQLLFHLRLNFTQIHSLNSHSSSPPSSTHSDRHHSSVWPVFTRTRFRKAIDRVLSNKPLSSDPLITNCDDVIHQTSWLEILLKDLTCLSENHQFSFLSSLAAQPSLIIYTTTHSHPFPSNWLDQIAQACPNQVHLFKVLPIMIDERKQVLQSVLKVGHRLFGSGLKSTVDIKPSTSHSGFLINELLSSGLLLQDSLDSLEHHILRPSEIGLLSASSVANLHQLLIPFKPSVKPVERNQPPTCSRIPVVVIGCLISIFASFLLFSFPILSFQSLTHPFMRLAGSRFLTTTVEQVNVTWDGLGQQPASPIQNVYYQIKVKLPSTVDNVACSDPVPFKESMVPTNLPVAPTDQNLSNNLNHPPCASIGNLDSIHPKQVLVSNKSDVENCGKIDTNPMNQIAEKAAQFDGVEKGCVISNPGEDHEDRTVFLTASCPSSPAPRSQFNPLSCSVHLKSNWNKMICDFSDLGRRYLTSHDHRHLGHLHRDLTRWSNRLPKRLRKSLDNIKNHPRRCVQKINILPGFSFSF